MVRPTAASHSYITRLISVFVDELIKLATHFPTVLRDSGELNQLLENTVLPNSSSFLVTADVASLYPNVDAKKALVGPPRSKGIRSTTINSARQTCIRQ